MNNIVSGMYQNTNSRKPIYIIKIGGSISTNKSGHYELNYSNIRLIGDILARNKIWETACLMLVFGGGSFGNVAPQEYNLLSRSKRHSPENTSKMTTIMFSMLSNITTILTSFGVPVYPFQCSALVSNTKDGRWDIHVESILAAMDHECIPIISGDLVFKDDGGIFIFSSDNVPELVAEKIDVQHILYYSDVEGLFTDMVNREVVRKIKASEIENYKLFAGPSSKQDVTGGMNNKINQIQRLVEKGISVELLSFEHFSEINQSLNRQKQFGTFFESAEGLC